MWKSHRVLLAYKEISLAGTAFETGLGTSSSHDDESSAEFEELAMPLFDSLYNFARWLVRNQNDAEDLVEEIYLKALHSFASFQRVNNSRAWMFRILTNTFLSSCSKLKRRMTVAMDSEEDGHELPVDTETPETILMTNSELVQRAIYNLPVHYRETLLLCEVEKMSYQEIAGIFSIPTGTVMSRLVSARKAVRESLAALPVDRHPRTQRKEPGATREVSADPVFPGEKDEALARQFSGLEIESIGREDFHR
jgi:RNA polymerase sigma-70 factor, ECF subfamily